MTITRVPLRDQVHRALVSRILSHDLTPGRRLSDSALAAELGVSRTPVREALVRLEGEGFLGCDVGRGFFVKPLSAREVEEVYPIVWTLETLGLRAAFPYSAPDLAELERLNAELARAAGDPTRHVELDVAWHRTLVSGSGNDLLTSTLDAFKGTLHRYEHAWLQGVKDEAASTRDHAAIVERLAAGDADGAAARLEAHWRRGISDLVPWLNARAPGNGAREG
jgi:DNA-binding GntR family transcriptional regulator